MSRSRLLVAFILAGASLQAAAGTNICNRHEDVVQAIRAISGDDRFDCRNVPDAVLNQITELDIHGRIEKTDLAGLKGLTRLNLAGHQVISKGFFSDNPDIQTLIIRVENGTSVELLDIPLNVQGLGVES